MEKVISYSLYGSSKLYCEGAFRNIESNEKYYPDWKTRIYVAKNCPALNELLRWENDGRCEIIRMPEVDYVRGSTVNAAQHQNFAHTYMTWRNLALFNKSIDIILLRDLDSLTNPREAEAIERWLESDLPISALYDNPAHIQTWGMTGLTGWKRLIIDQIYKDESTYQEKYDKYIEWYKTDGYASGLRFVHLDLWLTLHLFILPIGLDRIWRAGYNQINQLTVPMPEGGSCGAHLGSTVHEEYRYLDYKS